MATLGSLVINVAANAADFQKVMKDARKDFRAFVDSIKSADVQGVLDGFSAFKLSPVEMGLAATTQGFLALKDAVEQGLAKALEFKNKGAALGASAGDVFALEGMVGAGDVDVLLQGLKKVQRELGAAQGGSEEARQAFEGLGINWRELADAPLPEMAKEVARAVKESGNSAAQADAAFKLLGKSGQEALDALGKIHEGQKGGGFVSAEDVNRAAALADTWERMKRESVGTLGFWEAVGIKIMSVFDSATDSVAMTAFVLNEVRKGGNPFEAFEEGLRRLAGVKEADHVVNQQAELNKWVADTIKQYEMQAATIGKSKDELVLMAAAQRGATQETLERIRQAQQLVKDAQQGQQEIIKFETPAEALKKEMQKAGEDAAQDKLNAAENAIRMLERLRQQNEQLQLAAETAEFYGVSLQEASDMAGELGKALQLIRQTGMPIEEARQLAQQIEQLVKANADLKFAQNLTEQFKDPIAAFEELTARLDELQKSGAISMETAAAAAAEAFDKLAGGIKDVGDAQVRLPPALEAGSREAISAQNRFMAQQAMAGQGRDAGVAKILEDAKRQREEHQKAKMKKWEEIKQAIEKMRVVKGANVDN